MSDESITAGDVLRCSSCGHERNISTRWLGEIGQRHFPERKPMVLKSVDLKKFKCSRCGRKALVLGEVPTLVPTLIEPNEATSYQLATTVITQASPLQRAALLSWAQELITIRNSNISVIEKVKAAISATTDSKVIEPFVQTIGREIKRMGWDDRSWPARIGLGAAAVALFLPGKGAAGLAAFGGAISVPLWIVFGAGGAFAGVIIDEINRLGQSSGDPSIIEGEVGGKASKVRKTW